MAKKFSGLAAKMPPERRDRAQDRAQRTLTDMVPEELHRQVELSQGKLAQGLGEKQPDTSQQQDGTDMDRGDEQQTPGHRPGH